MTEHLHPEFVEGCYRCDLSRAELSVPERNEQARRERVAALIQHCRDVLHGTTKEQP